MKMNENHPYHKNNTFSKSPGVAQIASYIVFITETVLFYAAILPHLHPSAQTTLALLFSLSLIAMAITTIISSAVDPSD